MTKPAKILKRRLKAPRGLVEATKKGERFVPMQRPDTRATHIFRFSKALIAYACAIALLVGGISILPALIGGKTVSPASQPGSTLPGDLAKSDYVYLSEEQAADYVRPDLIWANELNPGLENTVIWSAEIESGPWVSEPVALPTVGDDDAQYAVEFRIERLNKDADWVSMQYMKRQTERLQNELQKAGFESFAFVAMDNDLVYHSSFYAAGRDELSKLSGHDLASILSDANGGLRVTLRIAWQSCGADDNIVWSAEIADGEQIVNKPMELPDADGEDAQYTVEFRIECIDAVANQELKRQTERIKDEFQKAGIEAIEIQSADDNLLCLSSVSSVGRDKLIALDTEALLSLLSDTDSDLRMTLHIVPQSDETEA